MRVTFTADGAAVLLEAEDMSRFHLDPGTRSGRAVATRLRLGAVGRLDGEHAWIDGDWLLAAVAAAGLDDGWRERLAALLTYAESRGWVDPSGAVRAHVERREHRA